jgi:Glycosyltransferase family 87
VALASVTGSIAMALAAVRYAVTNPQSSDFAGVAAAHQAQAKGLGCIYSRSVQLAGEHLVPGVVAPHAAADLIWHFNEPPPMTLLAAPFAALHLSTAVNLWEVIICLALAACVFLLWRARGGLPPLLMAAVVAGLLLNEIANTEFSLAQNDALLLVAALVAFDLLRRHQDLGAGLLLGLVAVKPQLIFLAVIALLIHQRWRAVAGCAATVGAIGALSILMAGPSCSLQWLGSATQLGEFQIGIGLPGTLARWTGTTVAAEIAFLVLAIVALVVLIRIRRRVDTPLLAAIAIAIAVVIGLHTLAYDVLFLAPLGMAVARSKPWSVIAAGWAFTVAQLTYPVGAAPVLATELVPFVAVTLAVVFIVRNGTPSEEHPQRINTASHQPLVAAT